MIVLRTFSKVYGMAGLRAGFFIAKPEYQAKLGKIGPGAPANGGGIAQSRLRLQALPACRTRA